MKRFYLTHTNGKEAFVAEVNGLQLMVGIDGVDHLKTAATLEKMFTILNAMWDSMRWDDV